jgi:Trypsin-co-occurring domain 2
VDTIDLAEAIDALHAELSEAVARASGMDIQFPVGSVQLEFQLGVTRTAEGTGNIKFWVLELGGSGAYASESIQKVVINLEPPVGRDGEPVKVRRRIREKP